MNWTGGKLFRSRNNANSSYHLQRQHFEKARIKRQNDSGGPSEVGSFHPASAYGKTRHPVLPSDDVSRGQVTTGNTPQYSQVNIAPYQSYPDPFLAIPSELQASKSRTNALGGPGLGKALTSHALRGDIHAPTNTASPVQHQVGRLDTLQIKKRKILDQEDWTRTSVLRPLKVRYPAPDLSLIGKRRKVRHEDRRISDRRLPAHNRGASSGGSPHDEDFDIQIGPVTQHEAPHQRPHPGRERYVDPNRDVLINSDIGAFLASKREKPANHPMEADLLLSSFDERPRSIVHPNRGLSAPTQTAPSPPSSRMSMNVKAVDLPITDQHQSIGHAVDVSRPILDKVRRTNPASAMILERGSAATLDGSVYLEMAFGSSFLPPIERESRGSRIIEHEEIAAEGHHEKEADTSLSTINPSYEAFSECRTAHIPSQLSPKQRPMHERDMDPGRPHQLSAAFSSPQSIEVEPDIPMQQDRMIDSDEIQWLDWLHSDSASSLPAQSSGQSGNPSKAPRDSQTRPTPEPGYQLSSNQEFSSLAKLQSGSRDTPLQSSGLGSRFSTTVPDPAWSCQANHPSTSSDPNSLLMALPRRSSDSARTFQKPASNNASKKELDRAAETWMRFVLLDDAAEEDAESVDLL